MTTSPYPTAREPWNYETLKKEYTAFVTPLGHLQFPEGIKTEEELRTMYETGTRNTLLDFSKFLCSYFEWMI